MNKCVYLLVLFGIMSLTSCVRTSTTTNSISTTTSSETSDMISASNLNMQLGIGYIQRGQYSVARQKLKKAIEQNPENAHAYSTLALLYSKLNKKDEAKENYDEALDIKPNNPSLHNSYGAFLCGIGEMENALAEFKRAYDDPFYGAAYLARSNAGSCMVQNGRYKQAEPLLRKALRINNTLSGALISMAEIGVKTKKYLMSRAYIQRYHIENKPTAASLWIQVQVENALNSAKYYKQYSDQLLKHFPDSVEAGLVYELQQQKAVN